MKYGIMFQPTQEFVAFYQGDKRVLFSENNTDVFNAMNDLLLADGGYDGDVTDFAVVPVNYETDGSEYLSDNNVLFVAKTLIK